MDPESRKTLTRLVATQPVAALGTLRDGAPFVSRVPFVAVLDATISFYIHISRLAQHTQDILADPRLGLMIARRRCRRPRRGWRASVSRMSPPRWRHRTPATPDEDTLPGAFPRRCLHNVNLADFSLFRIVPSRARYIVPRSCLCTLPAAFTTTSARIASAGVWD